MSAAGRPSSHARVGIPLGLLVLLLAVASILVAAGVGWLPAAAAGLREPWIVAVASDVPPPYDLPRADHDDIEAIAALVMAHAQPIEAIAWAQRQEV